MDNEKLNISVLTENDDKEDDLELISNIEVLNKEIE
jgi:hypothetical protein